VLRFTHLGASLQEHRGEPEGRWAKFLALTREGTDDETFSGLLRACLSVAVKTGNTFCGFKVFMPIPGAQGFTLNIFHGLV
jgi:hypothetical protein